MFVPELVLELIMNNHDLNVVAGGLLGVNFNTVNLQIHMITPSATVIV